MTAYEARIVDSDAGIAQLHLLRELADRSVGD